jgi:autotransporter-associated beta strand protein
MQDGVEGVAIIGSNLEVINRGLASRGQGREGQNWAIYFQEKGEELEMLEATPENQFFGFNAIGINTDGVVTFNNRSTYTQDTFVQRGTLNAAGDLSSTAIAVREQGTFMGAGSTGSLVFYGGRYAPGDSIGTQTVNGDYRFNDGTF